LKAFAQQVLAEHDRGLKILEAFRYANMTVNALAKSATWRRKSTRRHLFWEAAVSKLIELTLDDPGLVVVPHNDTVSFIFDDEVLVRLKKAGMSLRTSNYPTQTAELFHVHEADLFGHPGLQRVEAVYIPNRFDTDIVWAGVVARDGKEDLWHFEIAEPVVAPVALPAPARTAAADLATVKNQAKRADRKKGGNDV
jgi:hypothetical protein